MTVLQVQSLPALANQRRHIFFLDLVPNTKVSFGLDGGGVGVFILLGWERWS
jgi:hypothetical protein